MINIGLIRRLVNFSLPTPKVNTQSASRSFKKGLWWTLYGSLGYELIRAAHMLLLYKTMTVVDYGLLISFYSVMSLTAKIVDGGLTYSIAPFKEYCFTSKQHLYHFIWDCSFKWFGLPIVLGSLGVGLWFSWAFNVSYGYAFALWFHAVIGVVTSFVRMLLYTVQHTQTTVMIECWAFAWYCGLVWTLFLLVPTLHTIQLLITLHSIKYTVLFALFLYQLRSLYRQLPDTNLEQPFASARRLAATRFNSYALRIGRNFFSRAMLTPFFALTINFYAAGVFHLASKMASLVQMVIKSMVYFSGSGFFAALKHKKMRVKRAAFNRLARHITSIVIPLAVLGLIGLSGAFCFGISFDSWAMTTLILYSLIVIIELYSVLYEQFYIVEERAKFLLMVKVGECVAFAVAITLISHFSLALVLLIIFFVQAAGLALVARRAWRG